MHQIQATQWSEENKLISHLRDETQSRKGSIPNLSKAIASLHPVLLKYYLKKVKEIVP